MATAAEQNFDPTTATTQEAVAAEHLIHGLIAIAKGPDYCLCGSTWPCARLNEQQETQPR